MQGARSQSEERGRLSQALGIGHEISRIKDLDVLLESILSEARRFTGADAGSVYLKEGDRLRFSHTQNETVRRKLRPGKKLLYSTFSIPIDSRSIAGYVCRTGRMVNIPDVYALPEEAPYGFDRRYDEVSGYRTKSMLTFPIESHRGDGVGVLQLINAMDGDSGIVPFPGDDETLVRHFASTAAVAVERARMTRAMILRMINMAELRDPSETGAHVNRVAAYAVEIYEEWAGLMGMDPERLERDRDSLRMGAMLHDVGKIAIADAILKKPARLDPEETAVVQKHTVHGARLFSSRFSEFDEASHIIALSHHEKWDGSGYPHGLTGEETHPFGRVVAIADVFDALSRRRAYKEAWDEDRVLETMRKDAGSHFDPRMIEAFFSTLDNVRSVSGRYPDED